MTDADKLRALVINETAVSKTAVGRTGATAEIASLLSVILELRRDHHSWNAIAAGLFTLRGVHQINQRTSQQEGMTGRRLSALISALNAKQARHDVKSVVRGARMDLARPVHKGQRLSKELFADKPVSTPARQSLSQEALRREAYAALQTIMRKDQS